MIGSDDFRVFFNPDDFGVVAALYYENKYSELNGIFNNPLNETAAKFKSGNANFGQSFREHAPTFTAATESCCGISKKWKLTIKGKKYFVAGWEDDGVGMTVIYLALDQNKPVQPLPWQK